MWCDSFDADLLKVVPGAAEALGDAGSVRLWTYSRLTDGAINHPSAWHMGAGELTAFFWTADQNKPAPSWVADDPVAECTFLEAIRDEWVHSCAVMVDRMVTWRPPVRLMEGLMYDLRGWTPLADDIREQIQADVLASLAAAASRLLEVTG